jgi:hypothetical protein
LFRLVFFTAGYVNLFLFEAYCKIVISTSGYSIKVNATIFLIFNAYIEVTVTTGLNWGYSFLAKLQTNSMKQGVIAALESFSKQASKAFDDAKKKVQAAQNAAKKEAERVYKDCKNKCANMCNKYEALTPGVCVLTCNRLIIFVSPCECQIAGAGRGCGN